MLLSVFHFGFSAYFLFKFNGLLILKAEDYYSLMERRAGNVREDEEGTELLKRERIFKEVEGTKEVRMKLAEEKCSICLSELFGAEGERGVSEIRKCGHFFHTECISSWLVRNKSCPIDRRHL